MAIYYDIKYVFVHCLFSSRHFLDHASYSFTIPTPCPPFLSLAPYHQFYNPYICRWQYFSPPTQWLYPKTRPPNKGFGSNARVGIHGGWDIVPRYNPSHQKYAFLYSTSSLPVRYNEYFSCSWMASTKKHLITKFIAKIVILFCVRIINGSLNIS